MHSVLLPSPPRPLMSKQCGRSSRCAQNTAPSMALPGILHAWDSLPSQGKWFPQLSPMHGTVRSLFCTEVTVGKRLQESSWQAPNLEKLLSALSPSTRSFHFLLMSTHPPSPAPVCSAPSLPSQCWHFSGSGCWFGSSETPGRCRAARTHTWSRCICTVSANCLSLSVPLWSV